MEAPSIEVVDNTSRTAADFINAELASAQSVFMASAFVKMSGLRLIEGQLETFLKSGRDGGIVLGLDFHLTEPTAVRWLLSRAKQYPEFVCKAFSDPRKDDVPTFHPKLYIFEGEKASSFLIGSSNLTGGGLSTNQELNIGIRGPSVSPQFAAIKRIYQQYSSAGTAFTPNEDWLSGYDVVFRQVVRSGKATLKNPAMSKILRELRAKQKGLTDSARTQKALVVEAIRYLRQNEPDGWVHWTKIADWIDTTAHQRGVSFKWDTLRASTRGRLNEHTLGKAGEDLFIRKGGVEGREGMYKLSEKGEAYKGN